MILSRVIEHVKKQHWTAVFLDFVIVVMGVFIGIQLGNWNEARADKRDYRQALERYRQELVANLEIIDTIDRDSKAYRETVEPAFEALLSCEDSPENRTLVERGVMQITGTNGLRLRDSALRELTESQKLLAQESESERQRFAEARYKMTVFLGEAAYLESAPLEERMENNPILTVGPAIDRSSYVAGVHYTVRVRTLKLAAPLDIACKDNYLVKSFYTWERWQNVLPSVSGILRAELQSGLEALDK